MRRRFGRSGEMVQDTVADGAIGGEQPRGRITVRPTRLLIVLVLLLLVVLFAFNLQTLLPQGWLNQWPTALTVVGVGLLLGGMVTANAAATLAGPMIAALGLMSLLELPNGEPNWTIVSGVLVLALGVAIVLRGFTQTRV